VCDAFKFVVYEVKAEISCMSVFFYIQPKVCRGFFFFTLNLFSKHIHLIDALVWFSQRHFITSAYST